MDDFRIRIGQLDYVAVSVEPVIYRPMWLIVRREPIRPLTYEIYMADAEKVPIMESRFASSVEGVESIVEEILSFY